MTSDLRFPVGPYEPTYDPGRDQIAQWIDVIDAFPGHLVSTLEGVSIDQLSWPYRPNGWMVKQVVHHCLDSHMNAYIRFKLTLTEDTPTIRPYYEDRWADLPDSKEDNLSDTLDMLILLHRKWVSILKGLSSGQLDLEYLHPEYGRPYTLKEAIGNYAWHCDHHLGHVKQALASDGAYVE